MIRIMSKHPEGTRNSGVMEVGVSKHVLSVCFSAVSNKSDLPRIHQLPAVHLALGYKFPARATETFSSSLFCFLHLKHQGTCLGIWCQVIQPEKSIQ